ncbi:hypothetical protein CLV35_1285 [Motilibacter peucedani]|uniref:Uncharacterized protein n=2 Tax=Motilibacter peucedani TaxID=598650 RepID=A0A420XS14_9ACTN|nr:hypothetical protein CLV35_1285 [Motilibacter peucedani]
MSSGLSSAEITRVAVRVLQVAHAQPTPNAAVAAVRNVLESVSDADARRVVACLAVLSTQMAPVRADVPRWLSWLDRERKRGEELLLLRQLWDEEVAP